MHSWTLGTFFFRRGSCRLACCDASNKLTCHRSSFQTGAITTFWTLFTKHYLSLLTCSQNVIGIGRQSGTLLCKWSFVWSWAKQETSKHCRQLVRVENLFFFLFCWQKRSQVKQANWEALNDSLFWQQGYRVHVIGSLARRSTKIILWRVLRDFTKRFHCKQGQSDCIRALHWPTIPFW